MARSILFNGFQVSAYPEPSRSESIFDGVFSCLELAHPRTTLKLTVSLKRVFSRVGYVKSFRRNRACAISAFKRILESGFATNPEDFILNHEDFDEPDFSEVFGGIRELKELFPSAYYCPYYGLDNNNQSLEFYWEDTLY